MYLLITFLIKYDNRIQNVRKVRHKKYKIEGMTVTVIQLYLCILISKYSVIYSVFPHANWHARLYVVDKRYNKSF